MTSFVSGHTAGADVALSTGGTTLDWSATFTPTDGNVLSLWIVSLSPQTLTTPSGWTLVHSASTGSIGVWWFLKENCTSADTSFSTTATTAANSAWLIREYTGAKTSGAWDANGIAEDESNVTTASTSCATGTTGTLSQSNGLAIAIAAIDSESTGTGGSWSGSFAEATTLFRSSGDAGIIRIAELATSATTAQSATYSGFSNDQNYGAIVVLYDAGGGDVTAPVLTSPSFTATGTSTGTASVSTDEGNGTLYCVVTTSSTSPSAAQIKAGNDHTGSAAAFAAGSGSGQAVSGAGTQNVNATGLSPSTTYYAHFVHDDAAANESNVASDATGDTTDAADVTAPTLSSPTGTGGTLTCTGSVSTNEGNGTLYAVVTDSATAPSAAQVKAGQDHTGSAALRVVSQAVSGTGVQSIGSGAVTAGTRYWHYMHEDAATNQSAVASSASFTVSASASDIRLQPALDLLSGADAASLSGLRWAVFSDGTASVVAHSGGSLTTNSSGQATIDINASDFTVGDWVLLMICDPDTGTVTEADREVGVFLGWVEAVAQA